MFGNEGQKKEETFISPLFFLHRFLRSQIVTLKNSYSYLSVYLVFIFRFKSSICFASSAMESRNLKMNIEF